MSDEKNNEIETFPEYEKSQDDSIGPTGRSNESRRDEYKSSSSGRKELSKEEIDYYKKIFYRHQKEFVKRHGITNIGIYRNKNGSLRYDHDRDLGDLFSRLPGKTVLIRDSDAYFCFEEINEDKGETWKIYVTNITEEVHAIIKKILQKIDPDEEKYKFFYVGLDSDSIDIVVSQANDGFLPSHNKITGSPDVELLKKTLKEVEDGTFDNGEKFGVDSDPFREGYLTKYFKHTMPESKPKEPKFQWCGITGTPSLETLEKSIKDLPLCKEEKDTFPDNIVTTCTLFRGEFLQIIKLKDLKRLKDENRFPWKGITEGHYPVACNYIFHGEDRCDTYKIIETKESFHDTSYPLCVHLKIDLVDDRHLLLFPEDMEGSKSDSEEKED